MSYIKSLIRYLKNPSLIQKRFNKISNNNWIDSRKGLSSKEYQDYDTYVNHQSQKLELTSWIQEYDIKTRG